MAEFRIETVYTHVFCSDDEAETIKAVLRYPDPSNRFRHTRGWSTFYNYLFFTPTLEGSHCRFFSGLVPYVRKRLEMCGFSVSVTSDSSLLFKLGEIFNPPVDYLDGISLRDYQIQAVKKAILRNRGIIRMPARSGKTAMAAAIIKKLGAETLFIVNSQFLLYQTADSFRRFGLSDVGLIGDGEVNPNKITVATVQSLDRKLSVGDPTIVEVFGGSKVMFMDEAHHTRANTWISVGAACNAPYRFGLSATPFSSKDMADNYEDHALVGLFGDIIVDISPDVLIRRGFLAKPRLFLVPIDRPKVECEEMNDAGSAWSAVYREGIVENEYRNGIFVDIARRLYDTWAKVLILVSRKDHGLHILEMLSEFVPRQDLIFSMGQRIVYDYTQSGIRMRRWPFSLVRGFIEMRDRVVVVGTQVYDEGVDLPSLDAVIILAAQRKFRLVIQRTGRPLTPSEGKTDALIIDAVDTTHPWLKRQSSERRLILLSVYEGIDVSVGMKPLLEEIQRRKDNGSVQPKSGVPD